MRPPKNRFFGSSFRILSGPPLPIPRQTSTPICQREFAPFPFLLILSGASNNLFFLDDCAGKPRSSKRQKCHRKGDPRPVFIVVVSSSPISSKCAFLIRKKGTSNNGGVLSRPRARYEFYRLPFPFQPDKMENSKVVESASRKKLDRHL